MAIAKKILKGIGNVLTEPNTVKNGGGWSSYLIPRRFTGVGAAVAVGGIGAAGMAHEGFKSHNKASLGRISYDAGLARMTGSYNSGVVQTMKRTSGGNYAVFSDMAKQTVSGPDAGGSLETYGATPELISALYHMGGR